MNRHLSDTIRKAHRQPPGRLACTGQRPDQRRSAFCSRHPGFQNCLRIFIDHAEIQRSSIKQNHSRIRIDRSDLSQKLLLDLGKFQDTAAGRLTGLEKMLSQKQNDLVCLPRRVTGCFPHRILILVLILLTGTKAYQLCPGIKHRAALRKNKFPFRRQFPGRLFHRHSVFRVSQERPAAQKLFPADIRTDQRNLFSFFQRKESTVVFQQYKGSFRRFAGQRAMFFTKNHRLFLLRIGSLERILKKSKLVLQFQDPHHCLIQQVLADLSPADQLLQLFRIDTGHHIDIYTGFQCPPRCIRTVAGQSVGDRLPDRAEIADQNTVKAHLIAEDLPHQFFVDRRRDVVDGIKGSHHQRHTGVDRRLVRRKIIFPEGPLRQLDGVVVPSRVRSAVTGKMLDTGAQRLLSGQVFALIPSGHRFCKLTVQVYILPCGLHHPSPTGIPHQICHRRKRNVQPGSRSFPRRHLRTFPGEFRQKRRALRQGDRIDGPISVDDIQHEDQRNMMRMMFHILLLNFTDLFCSEYAEHRSGQQDVFLCHAHLLHWPHRSRILCQQLAGNLKDLSDLFSQGHVVK